MSNETILLVIKFKTGGSLRFLSHAETVKLFQRACVRAGIDMQYSRGFNPRPRLSLPLPRTVSVASDDDLLCLRVNRDPNGPQVADYESRIKDRLSGQLPKDCVLLSVEAAEANVSYQPDSATYIFSVTPEYINEELKAVIERLIASESLNLQRRVDAIHSKLKNVDVRPFLKSIETGDKTIIVECKISSAGTVRVDEILKLLELEQDRLTAPVRRTNVKWKVN
ncbi:MAG: TIGR03936 family radical SAM-associated protein [Phycisphaerae bacterium]|nr:TIGR03936 family radical SAM-associated protein [Phycisphaerae bacterium]